MEEVVFIIILIQTVGYLLLALPGILRRKKPEPIMASPLRGIVISPALEELVFRGIPLLVWVKLGHPCGLLMAGVMSLTFVAGHLYQADPDDKLTTIVNLTWKVIVAVLWTWAAFSTNSLAWPIFLHALNNTTSYILWHIQLRRWRRWVRG